MLLISPKSTRCFAIVGLLVVVLFSGLTIATAQERRDVRKEVAAAADPVAKVNFIDLRVRVFDLEDGNDRTVYSVEGAQVLNPKFKLTYGARYWETDVTGSDRSGWGDFELQGIYFAKEDRWREKEYRMAVGFDLIIDGDNVDKGIGRGADIIGPLFAVGLVPRPGAALIGVVKYLKSFDEEPGRHVEETRFAFSGIQKLRRIDGWFRLDARILFNHENDDKSTTALSFQLGKQLKPTFSVYVEGLLDIAGQKSIDDGYGIAGRFLF